MVNRTVSAGIFAQSWTQGRYEGTVLIVADIVGRADRKA
jgi:hypothetical protein